MSTPDNKNHLISSEPPVSEGGGDSLSFPAGEKSPFTDIIDSSFAFEKFTGMQSLSKSIASIVSSSNALEESLQASIKPIITGAKNLFSLVNQIDIELITNTLSAMQKSISTIVNRLQIPLISEERKQELLTSCRKWGEYGWTYNPTVKFDRLFHTEPTNKQDADRKALQRIKDQELLFQTLKAHNRCKVPDLNEAIENYQNRHYKSCALMLFALIEAPLIRLQRKEETKGQRRGVGIQAVQMVKTRIDATVHEELLMLAMFYTNLFACLGKVFENGKDFRKQPVVINRNFLDHGMLTRQVRKKECLQLFILYYNVLEMVDMLYDIPK